jgi:Tfp pilus assembly protein PilX
LTAYSEGVYFDPSRVMKKITVLYIFLSVGILIITSCNEVVTEKRMSQIQRAIANGDVE